ncbi:MAG: hypothetical protein KZQ83_13170 [gamma proteobacterium symbiont of Taylorina sp.]|nr:hypothetical protein [gamma proteobacterium symbiont of Taylorina sp.]
MSGDIQALTSLTPTPLVREKRHYPGDQKKQKQQQKQQQTSEEDENAEALDSEEQGLKNKQEKNMDSDEKNVRVMHIDEYV